MARPPAAKVQALGRSPVDFAVANIYTAAEFFGFLGRASTLEGPRPRSYSYV